MKRHNRGFFLFKIFFPVFYFVGFRLHKDTVSVVQLFKRTMCPLSRKQCTRCSDFRRLSIYCSAFHCLAFRGAMYLLFNFPQNYISGIQRFAKQCICCLAIHSAPRYQLTVAPEVPLCTLLQQIVSVLQAYFLFQSTIF